MVKLNAEEMRQIEAMFDNTINRMDGVKGELQGLKSDIRSFRAEYLNGFEDIKQITGEIQKDLDAIIVATKR